MKKINPGVKALFDAVVTVSKKAIVGGNNIPSSIIILKKDRTIETIPVIFESSDEKEELRIEIINKISQMEIQGYVVLFDALMTKIDPKGILEPEVLDVITMELCSPTYSSMNIIIHKDKKIIEEPKFTDDEMKSSMSDWNIWARSYDPLDKKEKQVNEEYFQFKKDNPDKFRSVQ